MHEVSIMQNTLDIAIAQAQENSAKKIDNLTMNIGKLSGVIPEALEFAFDILIQGTIAENAQLKIKTIPIVCYCQSCDHNFQPAEYIFECPQCQEISINIVTGRELELASVVVSS
ncbi:hydrogenase nickel insertion protein HypA [Xenococcus sp. PCC 7305]|uniref:hydrogenase maturation nickel metallochaperone HypA n=1 Tax=Xenococcus sp. PCC 7305 TaxID=102125 RepID=UPI0002ACD5B3|nr:hydrogenase maturation nickel metallochaperone HypA [Xenococcus sp. PCC 7305]ELS00784.1 hydrogenase nickel insertion protein HypA [Xenococcus sp. PCC 7305]